jgi:hypothetical protein
MQITKFAWASGNPLKGRPVKRSLVAAYGPNLALANPLIAAVLSVNPGRVGPSRPWGTDFVDDHWTPGERR